MKMDGSQLVSYRQLVSDVLHQQMIVDALDKKLSRYQTKRETESEVLAKLQERLTTMEARYGVVSQ